MKRAHLHRRSRSLTLTALVALLLAAGPAAPALAQTATSVTPTLAATASPMLERTPDTDFSATTLEVETEAPAPAEPSPTASHGPSESPIPTAAPMPTVAPSPTVMPEPSPTATPTTTPTATPQPSPTPTPTSEPQRPDRQSDLPAPAGRDKLVIENVHTDMVSAYLDDGELVLQSKADFDADGDGVIDLGTRIDPTETLFHLANEAVVPIPDVPDFAFLGDPGQDVWLAPQIQNHELIWPGFSTEDPALSGQVEGNHLDVRLTDVEGPGTVEVFTQTGAAPQRVFSSEDDLPAWEIGIPQHTHMNWAFSTPGTYTLTFEESGVVAGHEQMASNEYVFVVGDLDDHLADTTVSLTADRTAAETGEGILFTADVEPDMRGAVQFRDASADQLLGHTPVEDGRASFLADALVPGDHEIVAEFVPMWTNEATAAVSQGVDVRVAGMADQRPDTDDPTPLSDGDIATMQAGEGVAVKNPDGVVAAGGTLVLDIVNDARGGEWVSPWVHDPGSEWQGWKQADLTGALTIDLAPETADGEHRIVLKDTDGELIGWNTFTVDGAGSDGGSDGGDSEGGGDQDDDTGDDGDGGGGQDDNGQAPPPAPAPESPAPDPKAAPQECVAEVTLETGHIDAFYVSAANGQAVLQLMEDVTGHHVVREAETVLLRVKEESYRSDIPASLPGAPAGYVLPLTQDPNLIWPGWDTNRTSASGYTDVSIHVSAVDGPGSVHLYSQGSFGDLKPLLDGGSTQFPGTIRETTPAHTHAQWVFTDKGIYKLTAYAVVTNPETGESLTTSAHTYAFQVGDVEIGDALCGQQAHSGDLGEQVDQAVEEAEREAVAAAQEEAEKKTREDEERTHPTPNPTAGVDEDLVPPTSTPAAVAASASGTNPMLLGAALGAGGMLIVGGIGGGTVWYLRRLRST